jgi:hypothetical protein
MQGFVPPLRHCALCCVLSSCPVASTVQSTSLLNTSG